MVKKNPFSSEKGVTLVELVVAMGIASIIMASLFAMFNGSNHLFSKGEEKSFNQMHIRNVVDEITKDLRYAKNLTMLEEAKVEEIENISIPGYLGSKLDTKFKYIYFNKENSSVVLLEYIDSEWIERKYLEGRIDTHINITQGEDLNEEESYFILNTVDKNVKFKLTDKSSKYENARRFKLSTTINLLNGDIEKYKPEHSTPKQEKYRGIKYKE